MENGDNIDITVTCCELCANLNELGFKGTPESTPKISHGMF